MKLQFASYNLSNGITLIVKENHHTQSVVVRGHVHGGANWDPPDKTGLAGFATSMMRRGTTQRTFAQINETVESLGASVYVNCGRHFTTFGGKCLAEDFAVVLELMADTLLQPAFPRDEIENVRGHLITNLKQLADSPRAMAHRCFRQSLYGPDHPYGRPFSGTLESVANITRDDLLDFFNKLHPQHGVVIVVGDVQSQAVLAAMEAALGRWQPPGRALPFAAPPPVPLVETVRHIHTMPTKAQADLVLGYIGPTRASDDFYAAYVADTILGNLGLGGRIGKNVRDEAGLAYYARTDLSAGLGPTPWSIYAGVNPDNVDQAIDLILAEVRRAREQPVLDQELADAKSYITGVLPLQLETNEGIASTLLEIQTFQLGVDYVARFPDLINAISKEMVQAVLQKYLNDQIYALAVAGPYQDDNEG